MQHNDEDQAKNMESGDTWYFDEFGEYRNASLHNTEGEDLIRTTANEGVIPSNSSTDTTDTIDSTDTTDTTDTSMLDDDEFNETLTSPHIEDQLNDTSLQDEAEAEYHPGSDRSILDKIKDKFDDLT